MQAKLHRDDFVLQLNYFYFFFVRPLYIFLFKVYFPFHYLQGEIDHDTEGACSAFRSSLTWPVHPLISRAHR